jgi:hypothetical protein
VHVNLTPAGFGDKVAWEAMSCARPCLVANEDFRETLGEHADALLFRHGDAEDLARKLEALLTKSTDEHDAIGSDLRAQVERLHSLPRLAGRILEQIALAGSASIRASAPENAHAGRCLVASPAGTGGSESFAAKPRDPAPVSSV